MNRFFLDSGAFSANKQGKPVDLDAYISFIFKHQHLLTAYVVLDVIDDYETTWKNQEIMENKGLTPLPVFHSEDPFFCLDWCKEYPYFCLGGMAGNPARKGRIDFLDRCWDKLTDKNGYPTHKVHGFGMASPELINRYPWYSVDSSSPVSYSTNGYAIMPRTTNNKFDYTKPPIVFFVSARPSKGDKGTIHLKRQTKEEQKRFKEYVESLGVPFGKSEIFETPSEYTLAEDEKLFAKDTMVERIVEEGVINSDYYRNVVNYAFYFEMCARQPEWKNNKWRYKRRFLF